MKHINRLKVVLFCYFKRFLFMYRIWSLLSNFRAEKKKWQIKGDNMQSLFQLNTHSNFTKATNKPIFGCNNGRFLSAFIHTFLWTEMRGKIWNYGIFHTDRNLWLGHSLFARIANIATANIWYFYSIDCFSVRRSNRPMKEKKTLPGTLWQG